MAGDEKQGIGKAFILYGTIHGKQLTGNLLRSVCYWKESIACSEQRAVKRSGKIKRRAETTTSAAAVVLFWEEIGK